MTNMITQLAGDNAVLFGSIGQVETINILRLDSSIGGKVSIALPEKHHPPQPRPLPVLLPPRQFPLLIGRREEAKVAIAALPYDQPVEFYGSSGIGKTVLLRYLAHHPSITPAFPDGIVYHHLGRYQSVSDLLQILFDAYYENSTPFKHTDFQIRDALKDKKALILLDEAKLTREEVQSLINNLPSFTFLFTSQERQLWGEGHPVELCGLPLNDAISLVARDLGRSLSVEERTEAEVLCSTLNCHPLQILQALALVREENLSLAAVAKQIKASTSPNAWTEQLLSSLKKPQKFVLALLAALGANVALGAERIADITQLSEVKPIIDTLLRRNLVQSNGSGYSITSNLTEELQEQGNITSWLEQTVNYFTNWVQHHQETPKLLCEEVDAILRVLEWAVGTGQWFNVLCLGRAVEGVLALSGQWDTWNLVLQWILQAARAIGDQAAEAFALHQLGTRALCLNETAIAHDYLTQSLHLRESLNDQPGIEVTRHNLNFLLNLPLPLSERPTPTTPELRSISSLLKGGILASLLLILGLLMFRYYDQRQMPPPTPTPSTTPSTSTPSTTPPTPVINLNPSDKLEFDEQQVDTTNQENTVTISNTGMGTLKITEVTIDDDNADDFAINHGNKCSQAFLDPGETCTISISFNPKKPGTRNATLRISSNADDKLHEVPLSGTGSKPLLMVSLDPLELKFTNIIGTTAINQEETITITNTGMGTVTIEAVTIIGSNDNEFTITDNKCSRTSIDRDEECTIKVKFKPKKPGSRSATLSIISNADNKLHEVPLIGTGSKPRLTVSLDPLELKFTNKIGDAAAINQKETITITNTGMGTVTIEAVTIIGSNDNEFTIADNECSRFPIDPDEKCTISVGFKPKKPGSRSATLRIEHNATNSPQNVLLSAIGDSPGPVASLSILPEDLEFGRQEVDIDSEEKTITITNTDMEMLARGAVTINGDNANDFKFRISDRCSPSSRFPLHRQQIFQPPQPSFAPSRFSIGPDKKCTISVKFTPKKPGSHSATLSITSNAADSSQSVLLSGTGTSPSRRVLR